MRSTNARLGAHGIAIAAITLLIWVGAATPGAARTTAALQVQAAGAPQRVHGSDGREHVEYDLVITNVFSADATLTSLQVRGDGRLLLTLTGDALAAATHRVYTIPADAPSRAIIGSTTIDGPVLRIDRRGPIVISSPLRGSGWLNANGCCSDPISPHPTLVSSSNGAYVTPETFAVDWIRVVGGVSYTGDGRQNSDWPAYGAPVYAVANGTVVSTVNDKPEIPPFENNPDLGAPADYAGNNVILKLGPGRYAAYAHLQPGSVRVGTPHRVRKAHPLITSVTTLAPGLTAERRR